MTEVLTEKRIRAILAGGVVKRKVVWDSETTGFGLSVSPTGKASWVFGYRPKGSRRGTAPSTVTIGKWPTVRLDDARTAARIYAGKVAQGGDPARDIREQRLRPGHLVSVALDEFEANLKRRRMVNVKQTMSRLRRSFAPYLAREVETLDRATVVDRIEALEVDNMPGAANDLRRAARSFLEWCVTKGLLAFNPLAGLRRPKVSRAERLDDDRRKGRALDDAEIRSVWLAAGNLGAFGGLVRLGLITALRRSELAGLQWSDIGSDAIVIAEGRTKTGARHEVPLTPLMRSVVAAQPKTTSQLLFPSTRRVNDTQLAGWSQLLAKLVAVSGVTFRLHDMRRTTRTLMSRTGVAEDVAELAIGHTRRGLVGIYNKDQAWVKRIEAFERVSDHVQELVGIDDAKIAANVVPLRAKQLVD